MGRVDGRTALVTGGSRGIGRAIALTLAREGAKVAINYASNEAAAQEVAEEIGKLGGTAFLAQANVADAQEARAMVERVANEFSHLDILVNNAGITRDAMLPNMTDDQWVAVINTNLNSCFFCTSAAIPFMRAQSYGRVINISSMNGQAPAMGQANYSASKGGIIAFTKTAAAELVHSGITVNTIAPGYTETEMVAAVPLPVQTKIKGKIPMGRFAHPEEIAKAVIFSGCRRRLHYGATDQCQRRCGYVRRAADENLPPHPTHSPAIPAAQGRGEGTNESACRLSSSELRPRCPHTANGQPSGNGDNMTKSNDTFNPFDPTGMFKEMRDANMAAWSKAMIDLVNTDAYAESTGAMLDSWLTASGPFRKLIDESMTRAFEQLNLPSRDDITRVAKLLVQIEMRLDDLEAKLESVAPKGDSQ